ncbi:hypothetical protein C0J52_21887 [Blattella germanica]|nr:hypothetical protein C0J52_21887 [Blattella germanica]
MSFLNKFRYATCQQPTKKSKEEETYTKAPYYKDLERKQRHFQIDDGVPVYLKGGGMDKFLYQLTFFLIAFGLLDMVKWIYDMSYGKIKKSRK